MRYIKFTAWLAGEFVKIIISEAKNTDAGPVSTPGWIGIRQFYRLLRFNSIIRIKEFVKVTTLHRGVYWIIVQKFNIHSLSFIYLSAGVKWLATILKIRCDRQIHAKWIDSEKVNLALG